MNRKETKNKIQQVSVDSLISKLSDNKYFAFQRISQNIWLMLSKAFKDLNITTYNKDILESKKLSSEMCKIWFRYFNQNCESSCDEECINDIIKSIVKDRGENFMLGVADSFNKPFSDRFLDAISKTVPKNIPIYDAMCWKRWAASGEINKLLKYCANNKRIVMIGPKHFNDFGNRIKAKEYYHIKTHSTRAMMYRENYLNELIQLYSPDVVYIMQIGGTAMWLTDKLYHMLDKMFILDAGMALQVYYKEVKLPANYKWLSLGIKNLNE